MDKRSGSRQDFRMHKPLLLKPEILGEFRYVEAKPEIRGEFRYENVQSTAIFKVNIRANDSIQSKFCS